MTRLPSLAAIADHAATLTRDDALRLWQTTNLTGAHGRARAAQERSARRALAAAFGDLHTSCLPVARYHEALEAIAWPGQVD
jgi:hypothetical protein